MAGVLELEQVLECSEQGELSSIAKTQNNLKQIRKKKRNPSCARMCCPEKGAVQEVIGSLIHCTALHSTALHCTAHIEADLKEGIVWGVGGVSPPCIWLSHPAARISYP